MAEREVIGRGIEDFCIIVRFCAIVLCRLKLIIIYLGMWCYVCLLQKLDEDLIIERLFDFPVRPLTTEWLFVRCKRHMLSKLCARVFVVGCLMWEQDLRVFCQQLLDPPFIWRGSDAVILNGNIRNAEYCWQVLFMLGPAGRRIVYICYPLPVC